MNTLAFLSSQLLIVGRPRAINCRTGHTPVDHAFQISMAISESCSEWVLSGGLYRQLHCSCLSSIGHPVSLYEEERLVEPEKLVAFQHIYVQKLLFPKPIPS